MKRIMLYLDDSDYEKLKELKEKHGFKSWETLILSIVTDEEKLKEAKKNRAKEELFNTYENAKEVTDKYRDVLELIRMASVKLIDEDGVKAIEYLQKAIEELRAKIS